MIESKKIVENELKNEGIYCEGTSMKRRIQRLDKKKNIQRTIGVDVAGEG